MSFLVVVAVIVTGVDFATNPVTTPVLLTVAMEVLLLDHVTVPPEGFVVAVIERVSPSSIFVEI